MQNIIRSKKTLLYTGFYLAVFLFMFVFLSVIHPVQLFDGDDWTYISFARNALPNPHEWNPARIFPEIFMPTVGFIAAYFVNPILDDYLLSVTVTSAFVIALVVTVYISAFSQLISKLYRLKPLQEIVITLLFFIAHFWLFRSTSENNIHLFLSRNLTCYFYYTIPTLLCATLILFMERNPEAWLHFSEVGKGVYFLLIYLAVFSNLFSSIVLAAYSGVVLLQHVWRKLLKERNLKNIRSFLSETGLYIGIILAWVVSMGFELKGGRASSLNTGVTLTAFSSTAAQFLESLRKINRLFLICALGVLIVIAAITIMCYVKKEHECEENTLFRTRFVRFSVTAALVAIYQVLLCGVTSLPYYISCADVLISVFFFVLIALFLSIAYILSTLPKTEILIPLVICVAVFNCHTFGSTYQNPYIHVQSSSAVDSISEDIYNQVMDAYAQGKTTLEVKVPVFGSGDNWPLPNYMGWRIARTLYEHGQIDCYMEITIVPDAEKNSVHQING